MFIGFFIEPDKKLKKIIINFKRTVKKNYGNQIYLSHPAHLTLFTITVKRKLAKDKIIKITKFVKNFKNIKIVQDAMFSSTNEVRGTSYRSRIDDPKYQFAGKTGTAQVKRITKQDRELDLKTLEIPYEERDHALYVAYGPYRNPRYAVSILIEHGGSGSSVAAPIAKKLFKKIIDRHQIRKDFNSKKYLDI